MRAVCAAAVVLATSSCTPASPPEPPLPRDRDAWTVFQVDVPDRDSREARCEEGTIVIEALDVHEVRVACPKPATREQCEGLLGQISAAR